MHWNLSQLFNFDWFYMSFPPSRSTVPVRSRVRIKKRVISVSVFSSSRSLYRVYLINSNHSNRMRNATKTECELINRQTLTGETVTDELSTEEEKMNFTFDSELA